MCANFSAETCFLHCSLSSMKLTKEAQGGSCQQGVTDSLGLKEVQNYKFPNLNLIEITFPIVYTLILLAVQCMKRDVGWWICHI